MHERQSLRMQQHAMYAEHAELAVVAAIAVAGIAESWTINPAGLSTTTRPSSA